MIMDSLSSLSAFHFLRPLWLLGIIPVLLLGWQLWQSQNKSGQWQILIPAHLLEHLLEGEQQTRSRFPAIITVIAGLITVLALSGPTWRQLNTPVEKSRAPLVLVIDLSRSMLAADPAPDRLTRAKQKLTDILRSREDGLTALVAYAGGSHLVAPLTDDSPTLINLVRALHPSIMPLQGSRPEQGIKQAVALMKQGSGQPGTILLVTDGITPDQESAIDKILKGTGNTLSILGIGSAIGAPVPADEGGFMRDRNGGIVMAQLDRDILSQTARSNKGTYRDLSLDDSDIQALTPKTSVTDETMRVDRSFDSWSDEGRWLALLLLPFALLAFRRGWILPVLFAALFIQTPETYAADEPSEPTTASRIWNNLWQTPDQQGQTYLEKGNAKAAAEVFENPQWKAQALDQSGQSKEAATLFGEQAAQGDDASLSANNYYNQGNALARAGDLKSAMKSYDHALEKNPDFQQAINNRKVIEELEKQQEQQPQDQQGDDQDSDKNDSKKDSSDQNSDNSDNQNQGNQKQDDQQENDSQSDQDKSSEENDSPENSESNQNEDQSGKSDKDESQEQQPAPRQDEQQEEQKPASAASGEKSTEEQSPDSDQIEAWLRRIPNDPGGLLRRKFEQQQQQRKPAAQDTIQW